MRIALVDDDRTVRNSLRRLLEHEGWVVSEASSVAEAKALLARLAFDVVVLDHQLPDGESLDVLAEAKRISPDVRVVLLTGHGSIELAVRAVKAGAFDFLVKPPDPARLLEVIRASVAPRPRGSPDDLVFGSSPSMQRLVSDLERLRGVDHPVLLLGETGTGKSVLARRIHAESRRSAAPIVELNCATLTRDLVENELFGHERGAFTGASAEKEGLLEAAESGTVFLDEIGDIEPAVQAKILRALEDKRFRRVGGVKERQVDVRWLFATHSDLLRAVRDGHFRSDLYYRISTVSLTIPALRERREDVLPIARSLLERLGGGLELAPDAVAALERYAWPGNVRELRNVLDRAALVAQGEIKADDLRFDAAPPPSPQPGSRGGRLVEIEKDAIIRALEAADGKVPAAAAELGVPRSTLYQKLKDLGIDLGELKRGVRSRS